MEEVGREQVESLLIRGAGRSFPGAVAAWGDPLDEPRLAWAGQRGLSRDREPVTPDLAYDLASLTKILAAASLAMILSERGELDLERPVGPDFFPETAAGGLDWRRVTPAHLLSHQSGLRPWRPFYRLPGRTLEERKTAALAVLGREEPEAGPGERTVYSDLNFILLGFIFERLTGAGLPALFQREVAGPLSLKRTVFRPRSGPLAPTEDGFRHGGPVGHPEARIMGPVPLGQPHDDNARWLGGAAGHAGLFAPAREIWRLASEWILALRHDRSRLFRRRTLEAFLRPRPTRRDPGRPLGFNLIRAAESLKGSGLSPLSPGHTGYTGPAWWWDPERNFAWLFLTNRVHPRTVNPAWVPRDYQVPPVSPPAKEIVPCEF